MKKTYNFIKEDFIGNGFIDRLDCPLARLAKREFHETAFAGSRFIATMESDQGKQVGLAGKLTYNGKEHDSTGIDPEFVEMVQSDLHNFESATVEIELV